MRSLVLRFWHNAGISWSVIAALGVVALFDAASTNRWSVLTEPVGRAFGVICGFVLVLITVAGLRRATAVPLRDPEQAERLAETPYCLVLRPFGWDGEVVLRRISPVTRWRARTVGGFSRSYTLEQVIARAARNAVRLTSYAVVDQRIWFAPPGPTWLKAHDPGWQEVVRPLIRDATVIVLIVPAEVTHGPGFAWEIEQIVRYGRQSATVLALAPPGRSLARHQRAMEGATEVVARLASPAAGAPVQVHPSSLIIRPRGDGAAATWEVEPMRPRLVPRRLGRPVVADEGYCVGLEMAMLQAAAQPPRRTAADAPSR